MLPATENQGIARIDYNLSDKDHMFWSATFDAGVQATYADPVNAAFSAASYQPSQDGQGQWTHSFGNDATNQFVYAGSYYRAIFNQFAAAATFPTQLDLSGIGYTPLGSQEFYFPQGRNVTQYQFVDDFSLTKGPHNLKFGANYRSYDITDYAFSAYTNPLSYIGSVDGLYNGQAEEFSQNFANRGSYPVALWGIGLYAQDEWRITKNLRLTFAIRAEHDSNPVCRNCKLLITVYGSVLWHQRRSQHSVQPDDRRQSAPDLPLSGCHQLGASLRLCLVAGRHSDKTVVRGGFGIFYDAFPAVLGDNFMTNVPTVIPVTQFSSPGVPGGVLWADQTTPGVSPWIIGSTTASQLSAGFPAGASFASLSATNPAFASPSFNNMIGTFHIPRYCGMERADRTGCWTARAL